MVSRTDSSLSIIIPLLDHSIRLLSLEEVIEVIVHAGHKVLVEVGGIILLIVGECLKIIYSSSNQKQNEIIS